MTTSSFLVSPSTPTGNNCRIELPGIDLLTLGCIDNAFVYPAEVNIDQLKEALSRTLSFWPIAASRILLENGEHYIIEMCDNAIPITFAINDDLKEWFSKSSLIVELNNNILTSFIDTIQVAKLFKDFSDEPLIRLKLTHIRQSDEWILGISWYHVLGDAASCLHFSNTLSRFYQQMEPTMPLPIFERRLWRDDEAIESDLPIPKQYQYAESTEEVLKIFMSHQSEYDQLNLRFSGEQLSKLQMIAGGNNITIQDALTAYIILTLNTYCYSDNDERRILHAVTIVNFRGVSDSIAPQGQVANAVYPMLSDNFDDPYSLSSIASTVRRSIIKLRNPKLLESGITMIDKQMRENHKNNKLPSLKVMSNEITINSNLRYDWAGLVDFGYTDKCRFYTAWTGALFVRVFRLNPEKNENQWLPRDRDGAEASFRMEKDLKEKFLNALKRDMNENFVNVKT